VIVFFGPKFFFSKQFDVVGYSGVTDVAILQARTLTISSGFPLVDANITLTKQEFFKFGDSREISRGDDVMTLSFDEGFLKKMAHKGPVQMTGLDRGSDFIVSTDQLFFDGNAAAGSSGSGIWNKDGLLVMAPLTYGWFLDGDGITSNSGTSSHVSGTQHIFFQNFLLTMAQVPLLRRFSTRPTCPMGPMASCWSRRWV
jgi:hypothetical protein